MNASLAFARQVIGFVCTCLVYHLWWEANLEREEQRELLILLVLFRAPVSLSRTSNGVSQW